MANTVELEEINSLIFGLDAEASHLRASQAAYLYGISTSPIRLLGNQPGPSDVIDFTQPSNISVELEFGGVASSFWMKFITYTVQFIFDDFAGGGANPAPISTPVSATIANTFNYSALVNVPGDYLTSGQIYRVGAIVRAGFGGIGTVPFTAIYKGFIEGLILSDSP